MPDQKSDYQRQYRREYSQRKKRISITVSNAEYDALAFTALGEQKKVTTLVREYALVSLSGGSRIPTGIKAELQELSLLIRNIANNVNQIARHSNRIQELVDDDENNLLLYLKSLEENVMTFTEGQFSEDNS